MRIGSFNLVILNTVNKQKQMKNTLKNIAWAIRHPLNALCWIRHGQPYSAVYGTIVTLIAATALVLGSGCATTSAPSAQTYQLLVTTAAASATIADLQSNPQDAPYFIAGAQVFATIGGSTNQLTVAEVEAALKAAGNNDKTMQLMVPLVINLIDAYASPTGTGTNNTAQNICLWISQGINEVALVPAAKRGDVLQNLKLKIRR
jgi:hypothetical protein